jgi:hypothetical protein
MEWSEWFISKVREDLRDRVTTLDEIWGIMIFSPEKQSVAEAAARVAEDIISGLEEEAKDTKQELIRRRERIDELANEVHHLKEELLKLKTPISDNI